MRMLDVINDSIDMSLSRLWEMVKHDKTLNIFEVSLNNWPYYC